MKKKWKLFPASNGYPRKQRSWLVLLLLVAASALAVAQVNVFTRSNDNARTGENPLETTLTPANVNATNFGKLFTVHTDGQIYAQPLYVSNLVIAGGTHNVVFVASMRNTVYAVDGDSGTVLWSQNFGPPIVPQEVETDQNIVWSTGLGILSTPVIDPATNYMYFVSGVEPTGTHNYGWNLNAIDITTGLPVHGSPVAIAATYQTADLPNPLVFNAKIHNPRPGLAMANGNVYITFASHEDQQAYHGWVMAYSTSTLAQTGVYSDTTSGYQGGIWSAGQAPTIDADGNIYISTGNGSFGTTPNNLVQTGNSFIKLSPTLQLLDYFTPYNSANLNSGDQDLGASGLLLIPNTNYLLGGGKQGVLYLADKGNLGKFNTSSDQVRQEFQAVYGNGTSHIHGGAVYYNGDTNGPSVYVWGENDKLRAFAFNPTTGLLNTTPFAMSTMTAPATNNNGAMPGGFLAVSANNDDQGIIWASTPYNADAVHQSVEGVLYAFDAANLNLLWTDKTNGARDDVGNFAKYVPPVVANGKMYIPNFGTANTTDGSGNLLCYGLLNANVALPTLTVSANNATRTYSTANPAFSGTVTGAQNGDSFTESFTTPAATTSAVGAYPIVPTASGANLNKYTVAVVNGTLTISPAPLSVAAADSSRVFGAPNPTFTGTVTGAVGSDSFTESFTTPAAASSDVGTYAIVPAVTGPVSNYTVTTANGTLTVSGAATATAVSAPTTAASGANVTITATVTSAAGTPGGSVTFSNGATVLGMGALAAGVASLTTSALPAGTDVVTAAYVAAGNFAGSSGTANLTISAAPVGTQSTFAVSADPTALTVQMGKAGNTMLTFAPSGSYSGTVALSCANLPANASCTFSQTTVNLTGNNQTASVGLVINTTVQAADTSTSREGSAALLALAFWWPGGLTGLVVLVRKRGSRMTPLARLCLLLLCTGVFAAGLSGCGGSGSTSSQMGSQTTSQVSVVAAGTSAAGVSTHNVVLSLTVTP